MAANNTQKLAKIPRVHNVERVTLTKGLKKKLGDQLSSEAAQNDRHIYVYKFTYQSRGNTIAAFLVEPRTKTKKPCIIWNRGGSADFGAIKRGQLFVGSIADFARAGYIVVASQYAGGPGSDGEEEWGSDGDVADVLALRNILKHYSLADEKTIGMFGASRGGMMTYRALAKVRWIKAAVVVAGAANLLRLAEERPAMYENIFKPYFGGTKKAMRERSAVFWPDKFSKKSPLLIMHGTGDWRVSPLDSIELAEGLYKNKVPYRLILFEGADHSLSEVHEESGEQALRWFARFLKKKEPLPNLKNHGT